MKLKTKAGWLLGAALLLLAVILPGWVQAAESNAVPTEQTKALTPIKIGVVTWIGVAPLYLAQQKQFWAKRGLDVTIVRIQGGSDRVAAMRSGSIDAAGLAADAWARFFNLGTDAQIVLVLNESKGADGIVARNDIKNVKDFKGKKVAFQSGISSEFLLGTVLKSAGLTIHDIIPVDLDGGASGAAFVAHRVDVAVTFEPWLSKASAAGGRVIVSSADYPGLIVDAVAFSNDFIAKHPDSVKAFVAGYFDAVDYMHTHPDDAAAVMGQFVGLSPADFEAQAKGVHFYGRDEMRSYVDAKGPPSISAVYKNAAEFWRAAGQISTIKAPGKVINALFLAK